MLRPLCQIPQLLTDRLLLQRVGGRYRFIHKLVQEHFAAMPLKSR
ncbi:hypothetical protein ACQ4N7_08975 [Nodosilinea sp. AN01ver1]